MRAPRATHRPIAPARAVALAATLVLAIGSGGAGSGARAAGPPPPATDSLPPLAPVEPPPEAEEGADYEIETAEEIAPGEIEVEFAAGGGARVAPRRSQRVRFSGDGLSGSVREGRGDPLAGAALDGRAAGGDFAIGRLAPRWGRGLVLGAPADPWSAEAGDRGERAAFRGRAGEGALWRRAGPLVVETVAGRFARRDLAGARLGAGGLSVGALAARGGARQGSLAFERGAGSAEAALDAGGAWRAEAGFARAAPGAFRLGVHARAGHAAFRSLAEPRRSGPARAATVTLARRAAGRRIEALASAWRFAPGAAGARAALELEVGSAHHGAVVLGLEEQRGARRAPASASAGRGGFRHGAWGEWRGGAAGVTLALRHETWGEGRFARRAVRTVTAARAEIEGPYGIRLAITHTAWRARRGENLYLADRESGRWVLRALGGAGERARIELGAPAGGGALRGSLHLSPGAARGAVRWTLEWTRRARAGTPRVRAP
uniref:Uncharacterized protein n=1 Tax=Eiseniibacteriota bacterium TaxID=2212470 RepID=A0A832ICH2_UNCEI